MKTILVCVIVSAAIIGGWIWYSRSVFERPISRDTVTSPEQVAAATPVPSPSPESDLNPEDTLQLRISGVSPELAKRLEGEFKVNESGILGLPLIDGVPTSDRSKDEVAADIQTALRSLGQGYENVKVELSPGDPPGTMTVPRGGELTQGGAVGENPLNLRERGFGSPRSRVIDAPGPGYREQVKKATIRAKEMQ